MSNVEIRPYLGSLPLTAPAPHLLGACSAGIKWVNEHLAGMSMTTATFTDGMAK